MNTIKYWAIATVQTLLVVLIVSCILLFLASHPMIMILSIIAFLYFVGKAEEKGKILNASGEIARVIMAVQSRRFHNE